MAKADKQADLGKEKGKGGLVGTLGLMVVAGGAAFAMVSFLPGSPNAVACEAVEGGHAQSDESHHAAEVQVEAAKYVALEPMAVALKPDAGARTLRIGLAVGLSDGHAELEEADVLRLKDGFLNELRRVESTAITDPDAMPALRASLLHQARAILGEGAVASLLITDFLMK